MLRLSLGLWRRLATLVLVVLVGACGGGGGTASGVVPAPAGADYFPLNIGDVWYYSGANGATSEVRVTGTRVVNGRTVFVVVTTDPSGPSESLYEKSATGVTTVPAAGASEFEVAFAKIPALSLPFVQGQTLVPVDQHLADVGDLDGDGRADSASLRAEVTMMGFETLSTPAGTWSKVAHLKTVLTEVVTLSASNRTSTVVGTSDDWYAPDVGLVRSEYNIVGEAAGQGDHLTLKAYHAGALRSEAVAPSLSARSPAVGSVVRDLALSASFSEAMDPYGVAADALQLTGPDGKAVPGTVSWKDDHTLAFVPANVLSSGAYTARIGASVHDLVGNAVAGELPWTFGVDRDGPVVVSVSPADGAVEVPLNGPITIVFDEAPDPSSISAGTVQLSFAATALPSTLVLSGRTLTLTPLQPLERARNYQVIVSGVRDALGNEKFNGNYSTFKTDTGRFAAPQRLGGLGLVSVPELIVDVNGDQRRDLVVLGGVNNPGPAGIFVYRQTGDGKLAAPEPVTLQSTCPVSGVVAGDLDNNGRNAVVVSHMCGMEVLRQGADGRLLSSTAIDVRPLGVSQMALLRTAVRPAIVALPLQVSGPTFVGAPQVWRQDAAGNFAAPLTVPTALQALYILRVADINGDGLDDLVLWGLLSNGTANGVEVILQNADGSFGRSREFAVDYCGGANGVAAGDLNGDGRTDLVLIGNSCYGEGRLLLLLQDSSGGFAPATPLASATNLEDVRVADIDGDGRMDIVTLHDTLGVGVYLQRSDGGMAPEVIYESHDSRYDLAIGDLTGDGLVDIVSGGYLLRQKPTPPGAAAVSPDRRVSGGLRMLNQAARGLVKPALR